MDGGQRIPERVVHQLSRLFWFFILPLFLIGVVFPPRIDGYLNPYDEGLWLGAAQALLEGKKLYRDVFFHYGPLLGLSLQAAVRLLPPTLSMIRAMHWTMNAAMLLCLYACLLRWVRSAFLRLGYSVFLWVVPLTAHVLTIPMAARYGAGMLPLLCWPVKVGGLVEDRWRSAGSGLLAVVACLVSQEVGIAAVIAGGYYFCFGTEADQRRSWFLTGLAAGLALSAVWLGLSGVLSPFVDCAYRQTSGIVIGDRLPLPSLLVGGWNRPGPWFLPWQDLANALSIYGPAATYGAAAVYFIRRQLSGLPFDRALAALVLYGALAADSAWVRSDHWHIYFALSPALFLWAVLADRSGPKARDRVILAALLAGALVTLPHAAARQAKDRILHGSSRPMRMPRGGTSRVPAPQAAGYEFLVDWLKSHTRSGESFLFYPYDGTIYFLADRPNPCFYPVLVLAAASPAMQVRAVREITAANPAWVVWDQEDRAFDGVPMKKLLSPIERLIETRYRPYEKAGSFLFLRRNAT